MESDTTYTNASMEAVARSVLTFYHVLRMGTDGYPGMSSEDALEVTIAWIVAIVQKPAA